MSGKKIIRLIIILSCVLAGTAALTVAFLAYRLGFDKDQVWGAQRLLLAGFGFLTCLLGALVLWYPPIERKAKALAGKLNRPFLPSHLPGARRESTQPRTVESLLENKKGISSPRTIAPTGHTGNWVAASCLAALVVAVMCITDGTFSTWTPSSRYFDKLAAAFLQGSYALVEQPPAELLALEDPYDWQAREGLEYIWDASLYEGKYYLYFGPVPALAALPFKWLLRSTVIEDQYILMGFYAGFVISLGAMLSWLRDKFFPHAPPWTAALFTLLGGLCLPVLWLVQARYFYEVSIMGGQFFLILGLYAVLRGMAAVKKAHNWLLLGGAAWGAAIGCRMNHTVGIGLMAALAACIFVRQGKKSAARLVWLAIPLILWGVWLGYYNLARFGSVLEFGHRYQLTGPAYSDNIRVIFSLSYALPNAYNIFLRPPLILLGAYPYISAPFISQDMWPWFIRPPANYYYSEAIVGLLPGVPVLALLLAPIFHTLMQFVRWLHTEGATDAKTANPAVRQTWLMLAAGMAGSSMTIVLYIASTMRYLADIAPLALILLAVTTWEMLDKLRTAPLFRWLWLGLLLTLATISLLLSLWINYWAR